MADDGDNGDHPLTKFQDIWKEILHGLEQNEAYDPQWYFAHLDLNDLRVVCWWMMKECKSVIDGEWTLKDENTMPDLFLLNHLDILHSDERST